MPRGVFREIVDLVGQKIGYFTVVKQSRIYNGRPVWWCRCDCGKEMEVNSACLLGRGRKNCGCTESRFYVGDYYEDISATYWGELKHKSTKKNRAFEISREYVWNLFILQDKKCAISGIEIHFRTTPFGIGKINDQTASLDRIDSNKGYVEGNVQWVHRRINIMKNNMADLEFINWCREITSYQDNKDKSIDSEERKSRSL